ncbi:MAG TPA: flavodoxin family protein [Thermoguttaceae bacterium]|nr:flavodoxin family protein [Thermoguttaceae bacterium]
MNATKKILAIVGSYRKEGTVDQAVSAILASAAECGAETSKIYLADAYIEFCTNCRTCTQGPGDCRGTCVIPDDMADVLRQIDEADGLVLGSPVNFGDVTALTKRFQERLVCYAYWPWDSKGFPKLRNKAKTKKAVLVTSSAAPAFLGRLMMHSLGSLKKIADVVGAKRVGTLYIGLAGDREPTLPQSAVKKAKALGRKLAS